MLVICCYASNVSSDDSEAVTCRKPVLLLWSTVSKARSVVSPTPNSSHPQHSKGRGMPAKQRVEPYQTLMQGWGLGSSESACLASMRARVQILLRPKQETNSNAKTLNPTTKISTDKGNYSRTPTWCDMATWDPMSERNEILQAMFCEAI
jgi:hypothetical protein